jgi:hypothetical protein
MAIKKPKRAKEAKPLPDTGRLMHSLSVKAEGLSVKCVVAEFEFEGEAPADLVDTLADLLATVFGKD